MVTWELPDGSEVRCEDLPVEAIALREFVLRFMSAHPRLWDSSAWDESELAQAFERRFGKPVTVERARRRDGVILHTIRPRLAPA